MICPLGTGLFVLTGSNSRVPPSVGMVVVRVRPGNLHSATAYFFPSLQRLLAMLETFPSLSNVTVMTQADGHIMQMISCFFGIFLTSFYRYLPVRYFNVQALARPDRYPSLLTLMIPDSRYQVNKNLVYDLLRG